MADRHKRDDGGMGNLLSAAVAVVTALAALAAHDTLAALAAAARP